MDGSVNSPTATVTKSVSSDAWQVIHSGILIIVHSTFDETVTSEEPPCWLNSSLLGFTSMKNPNASWLTVKEALLSFDETLTSPVRLSVSLLGPTVRVSVASPLPELGDTWIHSGVASTVHSPFEFSATIITSPSGATVKVLTGNTTSIFFPQPTNKRSATATIQEFLKLFIFVYFGLSLLIITLLIPFYYWKRKKGAPFLAHLFKTIDRLPHQ